MSRTWRRRLAATGLLAPALVILGVFFVVPSAGLVRLSLARIDPQLAIHYDISLDNYQTFATSAYYQGMVLGSLKLTAYTTVLCLLLGYPAAHYMIHVRSNRYRTVLYATVVSPLLISVIVRTFGWVVLLANNGVVNGLFIMTGLAHQPVRMLGTFGSVLVATVHVLLPFMILPIASALQGLDPALERAAASLGASPAQAFWRVTLPLSLPGVAAGITLVVALALGIYITPLLVAGPLQPLLAIGIYYVTLNQLNFPMGAALSLILLAFTLLLLGGIGRLLGGSGRGTT